MKNLTSQIFIDGGDPEETKKADQMLKQAGFVGVEGQTTNPTLIAKRLLSQQPTVNSSQQKNVSEKEALEFYKQTVTEMAEVTSGPISIQVIADQATSTDEMLSQARVCKEWIPNGVVKFPCTHNGLAAAEIFCEEFPVNITLNFSQSQAAAVYQATKQAKHHVFISPFVGRLDDKGENGMQVVKNILQMYHNPTLASPAGRLPPLNLRGGEEGLSRVEVLTASVRKLDHILYALHLKSPAITIPFKVFQEWADAGFSLPDANFHYDPKDLKPILYQEMTLNKNWQEYDLQHDLTDTGLVKFMEDWNTLIK